MLQNAKRHDIKSNVKRIAIHSCIAIQIVDKVVLQTGYHFSFAS